MYKIEVFTGKTFSFNRVAIERAHLDHPKKTYNSINIMFGMVTHCLELRMEIEKCHGIQ